MATPMYCSYLFFFSPFDSPRYVQNNNRNIQQLNRKEEGHGHKKVGGEEV